MKSGVFTNEIRCCDRNRKHRVNGAEGISHCLAWMERMEKVQIHPVPKEILRLPDYLRLTGRVNERLNPTLWSSGGCLAGRYVRMNGWEIERGCRPACSGGRD